MNVTIILNSALVILAVLIMTLILLQSRSAGLGGAFGGGAEGFHVRRGSEKRIFQATVVASVLFLLTAFAHLFLS